MNEEDVLFRAIRWVAVFFIVMVPSCTVSSMYSDYTRMQMVKGGANPLEVGCAFGRIDSQTCALLFKK